MSVTHVVAGSSLAGSAKILRQVFIMSGWRSGQSQQTVNLPSSDYGGSNPSPDTTFLMFGLSMGLDNDLVNFNIYMLLYPLMTKFVMIAKAAEILGVSTTTLRRWESSGKLIPKRTIGNQCRYLLTDIIPKPSDIFIPERVTYAYARVSSHDQKDDLIRQTQVLEMFCASKGWKFEIITDLGSGMNYNKKRLKKLLDEIVIGHVERIVILHKDRLLRFGAELIFAICECKNVEVVIVNKGVDTTFEEDLAKDVLEIITVFS